MSFFSICRLLDHGSIHDLCAHRTQGQEGYGVYREDRYVVSSRDGFLSHQYECLVCRLTDIMCPGGTDDGHSGDVGLVGDAIVKAKAAAKAGFERFVVPACMEEEIQKGGAPKKLQIKGVSSLMDVLYEGFEDAPKRPPPPLEPQPLPADKADLRIGRASTWTIVLSRDDDRGGGKDKEEGGEITSYGWSAVYADCGVLPGSGRVDLTGPVRGNDGDDVMTTRLGKRG